MSVGFIATILDSNKNSPSTEANESKIVLDALQYEIKDGKNISEAELIAKLGEPDDIEEWNYETSYGVYPIRTLYYGKTEYSFNDDDLHRITIWDKILYNIVKMIFCLCLTCKNIQIHQSMIQDFIIVPMTAVYIAYGLNTMMNKLA